MENTLLCPELAISIGIILYSQKCSVGGRIKKLFLGKNKDGNTKCMIWKNFNRNYCSWLNTWLDVVLGGVDVIRNFLWFSGFFYGLGENDKMDKFALL